MAETTEDEGSVYKISTDESVVYKIDPNNAPKPETIFPITKQFLAGVDDILGPVSGALARQVEKGVGALTGGRFETIEFTNEGFKARSSEEVRQRLDEGGRRLFNFQATDEPQGPLERGARMGGQTLIFGPLAGRAAGLVKEPAFLSNPVLDFLGTANMAGKGTRLIHDMGQTFAANPLKSTAIEAGFGFFAGLGGGVAEQLFPDSDAAGLIGEIATPLILPVTPTAIVLRSLGDLRTLVNRIAHPFKTAGGFKRANLRADRAIGKGQREEAFTELDRATTIDPETGKPVLTPAQRTGIKGLLELERDIIQSTQELSIIGDNQISRANEVIQQSLRGLGDAPTSSAIVPIGVAMRELDNLLDARIRIAAQRADERIASLGPKVDIETANRIAGEEIESALGAARRQREELFAVIPENTAAPFSAVEARFNDFRKELGRPQQKDIPAEAVKFLDPKSPDYFGAKDKRPPGFRGGETRIKDLRALQSDLRRVARNARAGQDPNRNQARIADEIATAIDDDLANAAVGPEVADALKIAIEFSKDMADRFSKGTVGKILGRRAVGDPMVPPGMTLERSIGMSGSRAREGMDDLIKAFDSPEAPGNAVIVAAAEDFTRARFMKAAVDRGVLNGKAAERFVKNNEELLKKMPRLKSQIDETIRSGDQLALAKRNRGRIDLGDPNISKATMLIQKGPVETFSQISKLRPRDATKETQQLINRTLDDASGEALAGLKAGYVEFLMEGAAKGAVRDENGLPFLSGFAMRDALATPGGRAAANRLFTKDELIRLGTITRDLIRIEKRRGAGKAIEGVLGDHASKVLEAVSGIAGAAVGRTQARKIGIGGTVQIPGILAQRFRDMTNNGIANPARKLLRDAVENETLYRELLQAPIDAETNRLSKAAERRLNAWAIAVLAEQGGAFEEEESVPGELF